MEFYSPYRRSAGVTIPNWLLARKITSGCKLLYGRLCHYCGRDSQDHCWPKVQTLANELGKTKRQVQRYIAELVESGLLVVERHPRHSSIYRFPLHPWMESGPVAGNPGDRDDEYHEPSESGVTDTSPQGRHKRHARDDTSVTPGAPLSSPLEYRSEKEDKGSPSTSPPSGLSDFRKMFDEAWTKKYGDVRPHDRQDASHAREVYDAAVDACRRAGADVDDDKSIRTRLEKWIASFLVLAGWADLQRHSLWAMSRSISRLVEPRPAKTRYREMVPEVVDEDERVPTTEFFATLALAANGELTPAPLAPVSSLAQGVLFEGG